MAVIVFYDTTELDTQQLAAGLQTTDHAVSYVADHISLDNLDPEAEVVSHFVSSVITGEMIAAMPKLKLICCRSTGFNNVDMKAANERGITVVNVPTYGDTTVAEYTFTLLLSLTRRLQEVLEIEHEAFRLPDLTGNDLAGKTFGVIGSGHIGQCALKIAAGFGMRTLAYDVYPNEERAAELGFSYRSLEDVLAESDVISLHVPYCKDTHHILNRSRLAAMKEGAILINTARGALVDTRALVEMLERNHLAGAGLDVLEGEKLLNHDDELALLHTTDTPTNVFRHGVEISALKKMPNVIVSPHNAYNTVEAIGRINRTTTENIVSYYHGDARNVVTWEPNTQPGKLILLRHTESEWNAIGVWSGITDVVLSEKGEQDAPIVGETLKSFDMPIDVAFHTDQKRTAQTLAGLQTTIDQPDMIVECEPGFNERNYGEYTGMDKWKVKEEIGEERFHAIRRGWDVPFPNGETLAEVYERAVPAYQERVLPLLQAGKNVLIVAHGNSLRALITYLQDIPKDEVPDLEMLMNEIVVCDIDPASGRAASLRRVGTGTTIAASF